MEKLVFAHMMPATTAMNVMRMMSIIFLQESSITGISENTKVMMETN